MLKIAFANQKIKRRFRKKETRQFLYQSLLCVLNPVKPSKKAILQKTKIKKTKVRSLTKKNVKKNVRKTIEFERYIFLSQLHRYAVNWQSKLAFHSPFTKAKTICFLTGRSRSVYRAFRLSRLKIRAYGGAGHFVGLSKASW